MTMVKSINTSADPATCAATLQEFNVLLKIGTENTLVGPFWVGMEERGIERNREKRSSLGCIRFVSYVAAGLCYQCGAFRSSDTVSRYIIMRQHSNSIEFIKVIASTVVETRLSMARAPPPGSL